MAQSKKAVKTRLDQELVRRGLFSTTEQAKRAIMAGLVSGSGERFSSAAQMVSQDDFLHVKTARMYASRGGEKLQGAFAAWGTAGLSATGKDCLDVGCSTGGFTDCLLQQGARSVSAVDVGYAQFAWELRQDARVLLYEKTSIQDFAQLPDTKAPFPFIVVDVSFTTIEHILPAISSVSAPGADFVFLVKPQFELAPAYISKGGVVRDAAAREAALQQVKKAVERAGFLVRAERESPLKGTKGNQEYLLWCTRLESLSNRGDRI